MPVPTAAATAESSVAASAGSAGPRSNGLLTPDDAARPVRIARYWPSDELAPLVRHYWLPRWELPAGSTLRQDVLEYPTSNLVIEPGEAMLHRARRGRSARILTGQSWAFGAMLRPGTGRSLVDVSVRTLPPSIPLSALRVPGVQDAVDAVRTHMAAGDDAGAIAAFEAWLVASIPSPGADAVLVDAIVGAVENDRGITRVEQLADRFGIGVRHLQRLVAGHIGFGPKWLIQRYRLQEAAAALRSDSPPALADLAVELGYADQAHFGREFKSVIGWTPGAYLAEAAGVAGAAGADDAAPAHSARAR
ncbi:helix-turn-helix domain-containing protein [Leifsonia poae]|uniref:helix-turn-helix domain-containing protein n=1 Tax=Leifsonia poae TaxID=110933 RepID=UPI003D66C5A9